jgi:arylsulfatase A-like enzyme
MMRIFGKNLFSAVMVSLFFQAGLSEQATAKVRPNILLISLDDLNDWVGCLGGHPQTLTPNIDRLAADGMLFRNAYTAAPACNPSRTALFTGKAPATSGLYDNLQKLREVMPKETLMPRHFSNHGYWAAGSGKLLHYVIDPVSWDEYFPKKETDNPFPKTYYPKKRPVSLPRGGAWQYVETDWAALPVDDKTFGGDYSVSEWIGNQLSKKHDKPFYLGCGMYRPHEPWFVPEKYFEPFPLETIQLPPGYRPGDLDDVPPAGRRIARNRYFPHILWHGQWRRGVQAYLASIHFADAMVGRVLDALEKGPHADNTIVILWSDHGWHLGEKEHWQKFTGWRAASRVPLIIKAPKGCQLLPEGTKPGSVCDRPVSLLDLFATLTDLTGVPAKPGIDGHSLVPLLKSPDTKWPHAAVTHLGHPQNYAVSLEKWRYLHYRDGSEELYDIAKDPHEWTNRVDDPKCAVILERLRTLAPRKMKAKFGSQPGMDVFQAEEVVGLTEINDGKFPASKRGGKQVLVLIQNKRQFGVTITPVDPNGDLTLSWKMKGATENLLGFASGQVLVCKDNKGQLLGYLQVGDKPVTVIIE